MSTTEKPFFTPEQRKLAKERFCVELSDIEAEHFLIICERLHLDPFTRQIYARAQNVNRGTKQNAKWVKELVVITGIDGFRSLAEGTGEYRGQTSPQWCGADGAWMDVWLDPDSHPFAARVGIYREGFAAPLYAVARWDAFAQYSGRGEDAGLTSFWRKMGDFQLLKCAEAQALRKAFPVVLGSLYVEDEIPAQTTEEHIEATEAQRMKDRQLPPDDAKPAFEKAPKTDRKPATKPAPEKPAAAPEPEKPAPETQEAEKPATEAPAAQESGFSLVTATEDQLPEAERWRAHPIEHVKVRSYLGRRLDDFTLDELERMKESWVEKFADKIKEDGSKSIEAALILKAHIYRSEQKTGGRLSDEEVEKMITSGAAPELAPEKKTTKGRKKK